jgi:(S)-ureidoglycine aminohydrolase
VTVEQEITSGRGHASPFYILITPDNWVDNALPFLQGILARPMATPRFAGARFAQYLLDFAPAARTLRPIGTGFEHFLYQITGQILVQTHGREETLYAGGYCFLPSGAEFSLAETDSSPARMLWTKRQYEGVDCLMSPRAIYGRESEVAETVPDPPARYVYKELIPTSDVSYDMAMNLMICRAGGSIGSVEIHHQEHGLFMLSGQGLYYLAGDRREVRKDDFIYMAPYCPQSFWATGTETASYLLYKDVNRDGF